jgi:hypothetical protein
MAAAEALYEASEHMDPCITSLAWADMLPGEREPYIYCAERVLLSFFCHGGGDGGLAIKTGQRLQPRPVRILHRAQRLETI